MDSWSEITRSPEFQGLTPENKTAVKRKFYQAKIAPVAEDQEGFESIGHDKLFDWFMQQPDDSGQGAITSMLGAAARGAGEFVPGAVQGFGALTGIDAAEKAGKSLRGSLEELAPVNPIYEQSVPAKLFNTAGQMASLVVPAGAGGLVGRGIAASRIPMAATKAQQVAALARGVNLGAEAASLGSAGLQGAAQGAEIADEMGMKGLSRYGNILSNVAAEIIPEKMPFGLKTETALAKKLFGGTPGAGRFTDDVLTNAAEEALTQVGSNFAAQTFAPVGVEAPDLTEGALEAGLYGGFGGAVLGGVNLASGAYSPTPAPKDTNLVSPEAEAQETQETQETQLEEQAAAEAKVAADPVIEFADNTVEKLKDIGATETAAVVEDITDTTAETMVVDELNPPPVDDPATTPANPPPAEEASAQTVAPPGDETPRSGETDSAAQGLVVPTERALPEEDKAEFEELQALMTRRGQAQNRVKGISFSKKDEARFQELGAKMRKHLFATVDPKTDELLGTNENSEPIYWSNDAKMHYAISGGRVRTSPWVEGLPEKAIDRLHELLSPPAIKPATEAVVPPDDLAKGAAKVGAHVPTKTLQPKVGDGSGVTMTPTKVKAAPPGTEIDSDGTYYKILGYEDDGRIAVQNETGGWSHLPAGTKFSVLPEVKNRYAGMVSDVERGYDFLDRLKLQEPPEETEKIPSGKLPRGTRIFRTDHVGTGMAIASRYAITPDGLLYDDSGRGMTHGGASPWHLLGKIGAEASPQVSPPSSASTDLVAGADTTSAKGPLKVTAPAAGETTPPPLPPIERRKIDSTFERILKRKSTIPLVNGMFQVPYGVALKDPSLRPTNRDEQSLRYRTSTKGEVTGDFNSSDSRDTIIFDESMRGARARRASTAPPQVSPTAATNENAGTLAGVPASDPVDASKGPLKVTAPAAVEPPAIPRGRHRFTESKLKLLPAPVRRVLEARKTNLDKAWNFTESPSIDLQEDSQYTLVNPATGEERTLTTPGEFSGLSTGKNVVAPTKSVPLPKGAFVVYNVKTPGGGVSFGIVAGNAEATKPELQVSPTAATNENAGTLAGVPASDPVDASKGSILPAAGSKIPETDKRSSGEKPTPADDLQNSTLQPDATKDTGVTMTPTIPVHTDDKAASADVRLVLHKATHHYTLWFTRKLKDPSSPKGYRYSRFQYLSILGQDFDAAYQKALQKANEIASGGELPVSFYGGTESAHEAAKSVGLQDKAATKEEMAEISRGPKTPTGEKLVGFGKFSSLTVDQLVEKDISYADWLVNNGSSKWAREIGEYLRNENPTYIEWREAKNFKESSESDRIRAYEERMKGKKAAPQALPDTTNTTTGNVVKNKKVAKQTSRKAKDQIIDIVKPAEVPNVIPEALSKNMFRSQVDGANATIAAMERNGAALNGDGAGVGKTRQILAVASHYLARGKTVVIITENAAISKPWTNRSTPTLGGSMAKDGAAMGVPVQLMPDAGAATTGIYITHYGRVESGQIPDGAVLIFDESQGLVNIHDRVDPNKKIGLWKQKFGEILPKAEKIAYYSATPADKPHQLSYLYKVLGYETPEAFLEEAVKNGLQIKTTKFGNSEQKKYEIPFGDVKRRKLFKWVNTVMKKAGELGNFIKREISYEGTDTQFHDVSGIDEQKNPWAKQFNDVLEKMRDFTAQGWRLSSPDSYMLFAAELTKIGEAVKMAQRELAAGRKVVIYFSRIQEQEIRGRQILYYEMDGKPVWSEPEVLATTPSPVVLLRGELEKLGIKFSELHSESGETSAMAQKSFAGDTNVLLASVESGGTGINLDDLSGKQPRTEIFMFAPYRGISTIQALGRIWRASTVQDDNNPNRYVFVVASDIKQDAMRSAILAKKLQLMDASLGGTAVSRLPMSKVGYDPDQLVGMELPEEGVDIERPEADTTKELKPVKIDFKKSEKGNWWAPATADLLEWLEAGGVERTGLNVSAFKSKDSGKWIALAERQYAPEEFAAPAETNLPEGAGPPAAGASPVVTTTPLAPTSPQKPFVPETPAARDAREAKELREGKDKVTAATPATTPELRAAEDTNVPYAKHLGLPTAPVFVEDAAAMLKAAMLKASESKALINSPLLRSVAKLLSKLDFKGIKLEVIADGRSKYAGSYNSETQTVMLNLRATTRGGLTLPGIVIHEVLHHFTMTKLRNPVSAVEKAAAAQLEKLRAKVEQYAKQQGLDKKFDYEIGTVEEFVTHLLTRPDFVEFLDTVPASFTPRTKPGKFRSVLSDTARWVAQLISNRPVGAGSTLEQALEAALALVEAPQSERFDPASNSIAATPNTNDAEYMAAVESGDVAKQQAMVGEAAKAAIESNPRNVVDFGHFLTKPGYETARERLESLPRRVFYVGNVEVIRNPTGDDIRGMTNEERSARGGRRSVDPDTRFTKDNYGNTWRWKATGGMHSMIEPSISRQEGVNVNQNNGIPYHSDLVKDAIRSGEYIPSQTLAEYPNYADFVKSSSTDPITRDAAGNVIPLSQRFNAESNDIRFSLTSEDAEIPLNDAVEKIAALYADPLDPDNWPDAVAEQYAESPLAQAIDEGDFIKAWDAAPADAKDDDVAADIANIRAAYAANQKIDAARDAANNVPIKQVLTPAEMTQAQAMPANEQQVFLAQKRMQHADAAVAKLPQDVLDAADYDVEAADEWLNSDELVEAAKAPFVVKAKARAKATIKQVEATGRYVWNEGTEEFDAIDDEEVSVRYSKDTTDPIIDGLATTAEQQKAKERLRAIFNELSGVAVKDADGKIVKGVASSDAVQAVTALTKSDQVPNAAATWIGTREEFDTQFGSKLDIPDNVEGFHHNGRPYIITDRVEHKVKDQQNAKRNGTTTEVEAVKRLLKHEALVHGGWRSLSKHNRLQILAWARQNISDDQRAALRSRYQQWKDESDYQYDIRILEEFVANKVQALAEIPRSGPLAELWEMLKRIYRHLTGDYDADPTLRDVKIIAVTLRDSIKFPAPVAARGLKSGGEVGVRASLPSHPSPLARELAVASQRVREMLTPTPRKVDLQAAYRSAMLGKSSIYVTMDELFDAARKLQPQLTPQQFGQQVQNAYEDSVVALQTAESPAEALRNLNAYNVSDAAGLPGAYVTVLPTEQPRYSLTSETPESARHDNLLRQYLQDVSDNYSWPDIKEYAKEQRTPITEDEAKAAYVREVPRLAAKLEVQADNLARRSQQHQPYATGKYQDFAGGSPGDVKAYEQQTAGAQRLAEKADKLRALAAKFAAELKRETPESARHADRTGEDEWKNSDIRFSLSSEDAQAYARQRFKDATAVGEDKDSEQALIRNKGKLLPQHKFQGQTWDNRLHVISDVINTLIKDHGIKLTDLPFIFNSTEDLEGFGIAAQPDIQQIAMIVIAEKLQGEANQLNPEASAKFNEAAILALELYQVLREKAGRVLGTGARIHLDARFQHMFVVAQTQKQVRERQKEATDENFGTDVPEDIRDAVKDAGETAADELASDLDDMMELGERTLPEEIRRLLQQVRDWIYELGVLESMDAPIKASVSQEQADAIRAKYAAMTPAQRTQAKAVLQKNIAEGVKKIAEHFTKAGDTTEVADKKAKRLTDPKKLRAKILSEEDHTHLEKLVNKVKGKVSWKKLLSVSLADQAARRAEIAAKVKEDPALKDLTPAEADALVKKLDSIWEKRRAMLIKQLVEREIKRRTHLKPKAKEMFKDALPKFIEAINNGSFTDELVFATLAEKFGVRDMTPEDKAKLAKMAQELQGDMPAYERARRGQEMTEFMQKFTHLPMAKILADYWTASVLSGPRTVFAIATAVLNGAFEVLGHSFVQIAKNPLKVENWQIVGKSISEYLKAYPREFYNAWQYVMTGDRSLVSGSVSQYAAFLNDGIGSVSSTGHALSKSDNPIVARLGRAMFFFEKLLTALDIATSQTTKWGALPLAYAANTKLYNDALIGNALDRTQARADVLERDFNGVEPTTPHDKARLASWTSQLMEERMRADDAHPDLGTALDDAAQAGRQAAMTLDPSGVGGMFYHAVRSIASTQEKKAAKWLTESREKLASVRTKAEGGALLPAQTQLVLAYLREFFAHQILGAIGLKFARFGSNKLNQTLSFVPILGALRTFEEGHNKGLGRQMILRNQAIGLIAAGAAYAILQAIGDDDDDLILDGGWESLDRDETSQLMAQGRKRYSFSFMWGGKRHVISYANWPVSGVLAAIGLLSDIKRYKPEQWKEKSNLNIIGNGLWAATTVTMDAAALSQFAEILGRSSYSRDPVEAGINKFTKIASNWAGGFIPRILKDADMWQDDRINRYQTGFERFAKEIPIYRRAVGTPMLDIYGKRVSSSRAMWSREYSAERPEKEYQLLGALNSRGIFLSPANPDNRKVGRAGHKRDMTDSEKNYYIIRVGEEYRQLILRYGERLKHMPRERAEEMIYDKTADIRELAAKRAYGK